MQFFFIRLLILAALASLTTATLASPPSQAGKRAELIGLPTALEVQPAKVILNGPRSSQQLVVTGKYADGSVRDLTHLATITPGQNDLIEINDAWLRGKKNGTSELSLQAGAQTAKIPIVVENMELPQQVSFRHQVIAAMNVGGCNAGACHGTPSGKNGFRLSLRGFDPAQDYVQLTRDVMGRRTNSQNPFASLLLNKGMGRVPHEGGAKIGADTVGAEMIAGWMAEGLKDDPKNLPGIKKIEVLPGMRVLKNPARWQQLAVVAHLENGEVRDVTRLTVFSSSDSSIAEVNQNGLVEFRQAGEVAILCRYLEELQSVRLTYLEPREGFVWNAPPEANYIDQFVFKKLQQMTILPSEQCTDEEFIRRAYLDVCGMLPPSDIVTQFLADKSADKRSKLIDQLLSRSEYADFWALKWADVFRSNRKSIQLKGVHAFQLWLREEINQNTPFDATIREMLTASGNTFENPAANYYRVTKEPTALAETTAQLFFGVRMQCAKCHNHPFERWSQNDYYSMAAWFAQVKSKKDQRSGKATKENPTELIYFSRDGEMTQPRTGKVMAPKFLGGAIPKIERGQDRREVLAAWLTSADNPFFAKSVANRIWYHLNGKGIVDPVDDFRDSNPSCNDELLDALAKDFAAHHFDVKHLIRTIMNSRTYQFTATPNVFNRDDTKYFSHATTKLLGAEQLLDALCDVTAIPEKFTGLPLGTRAIQLPDGEVNHPFLKTFGQPARELACECERESDSNLAQALQLINGPTINEKIRNPNNRLGKLLAEKKSEKEILDNLYLVALARFPSNGERSLAISHVTTHADKRKAWEDVYWAVLNTKEFLFRH